MLALLCLWLLASEDEGEGLLILDKEKDQYDRTMLQESSKVIQKQIVRSQHKDIDHRSQVGRRGELGEGGRGEGEGRGGGREGASERASELGGGGGEGAGGGGEGAGGGREGEGGMDGGGGREGGVGGGREGGRGGGRELGGGGGEGVGGGRERERGGGGGLFSQECCY